MLHRALAHTRTLLETLRDTPDLSLSAEERRSLDEAIDTLNRLAAYLVEKALPHPRSVPFGGTSDDERRDLRERVKRLVDDGWLNEAGLIEAIARELTPPSEM